MGQVKRDSELVESTRLGLPRTAAVEAAIDRLEDIIRYSRDDMAAVEAARLVLDLAGIAAPRHIRLDIIHHSVGDDQEA